MENLLPLGLIIELALLQRLRKQERMLVGREARKVAQTSRVNGRVRILEPLVYGLKFGEDARGVSVDLVDGGHVSLPLVSAQVEANILLQSLLLGLGVRVRLSGKVHRRLVQTEHGPLDRLEAIAVECDQREVVALELDVATVGVKALLNCRLLFLDELLLDLHFVEQVELTLPDVVLALAELLLEEVNELVVEQEQIGRGRACDHHVKLIPGHIQLDQSLGQFPICCSV